MRRLALAIALLCGGGLPAGGQAPVDEIQELLDRRAVAMLAGDRAGFMRTIAHTADADFVRRQGFLFDGYEQIGLTEYELTLETDTWDELTTEAERDRHGPAARAMHVEERYRLRGVDERPAVDDLFLTFVPVNGGWRIASDGDLADLTLHSGRKLWELGPIETHRSDRVLYVSHPPRGGQAERLTALAEEAIDRVAERWSLPWSERVVIVVPSDGEELRRLIQATFDLDVFVAFATSSVDRSEGWRLSGHRVVIHWPNFSRYAREVQTDILVHELLHVATREHAGPFVPAFVDEGVAEWVLGEEGGALLEGRVADGSFDRALPLDHEFSAGADEDILVAYQEATSAMGFAAERFGAPALERFYRRLGRARLEPGTWRRHVAEAMREVFGLGLSRFERAWARHVVSG